MSEQKLMKIYNAYIKRIANELGHNSTTNSREIEQLGKGLFGSKFLGVYASDNIPNMPIGKSCVANLDSHDEPGSHWISLYRDKGELLIYDSFGRKTIKILPKLHKTQKGGNLKIVEADRDAEQDEDTEFNCGHRCIAWLQILYTHGKESALKI